MTIEKIFDAFELIENNKEELLKNSKELAPVYNAIVKLMMEFKQNYSQLHVDISNTYINKLKTDPDIASNISKIRSITGLTEGAVKKGLKNKLEHSIEKQKNLLAASYTEINAYCFNNRAEKMPITEFYRAMQSYGDGHVSVKSQLSRLIEIGLINQDCEGVSIIYDKPFNLRSNDEYLRIISEGMNQFISTVIYNKARPDYLPALFQRRLRSTQIHPKNTLVIAEQVNDILGKCIEQLHDLLTQYEEDVISDTYPEIIISLFQYNKTLTENKT